MNWSGSEIKSFRKSANLSQTEFANILGVRQQTISEWEVGKHCPTVHMRTYIDKVVKKINNGDIAPSNLTTLYKYDRLYQYLKSIAATKQQFGITFKEIESIVHLPKRSYTKRGWWSNYSGYGQARAWLQNNLLVDFVDFYNKKVFFRSMSVCSVWNGKRIEELRNSASLTRAELAKLLGVTEQAVRVWEQDAVEPNDSNKEKLNVIATLPHFQEWAMCHKIINSIK